MKSLQIDTCPHLSARFCHDQKKVRGRHHVGWESSYSSHDCRIIYDMKMVDFKVFLEFRLKGLSTSCQSADWSHKSTNNLLKIAAF